MAAAAASLRAGVSLALPGGGGRAGCKDVLVRQACSNTGREGHPEGPEPTILGHLLQHPAIGVVFIAASGHRGWSRQQELWQRQPPRVPQLSMTPSLSPLQRQQVLARRLPKPRRRPGATLCLAGSSALTGLARTSSVSSAPGGHPISTRRPGLLLSLWHCLLWREVHALESLAASPTSLEPAWVSGSPADT